SRIIVRGDGWGSKGKVWILLGYRFSVLGTEFVRYDGRWGCLWKRLMNRRTKVQSTESPARQLAGFVAKFDPAVAKVVRSTRAAIERADPPLPATGRGYTVIKSVSVKQRPRRGVK